jgi:hypothetical protein
MTFQVNWNDAALNMLAAIWMRSLDPDAVTRADASINRRLQTDPLGTGYSVSEGLYAIEEPQLRVFFEVAENARVVSVVAVREFRL